MMLNKKITTKYLMIGENLWIYFPSENDIVKISGHLLKDGMMGSDVSYEDALKSDDLHKKYSVSIVGDTTINQRPCYQIVLNGITRNVPYYKRRMSVDKEWFISWRDEMYSKSGKLLKVSMIKDVKKFSDRYFPVKSEIVNMLRKNSKTTFEMENLKFNEIIDESIFSIRHLSR
ncbi:MAG: outer membrane lipoprotein-sorting protein [Chitinispirillaceae bacterium]|nr:outer membrane lipoprotein-sorting protein [Chitinispirillaceae bacterium]